MSQRKDLKRLFLVGPSRSGTTIIQRTLSENLGLFSLPETAFFMERLASPKKRTSALWRLNAALSASEGAISSSRNAFSLAPTARRIARSLYSPSRAATTCKAVWSPEAAASFLLSEMDGAAGRRGLNGWLEKTPMHCLHMNQIRDLIRPDGFVFVLRDGPATIASIRDRAIKYPERHGWQYRVQKCINVWNSAIDQARRQAGNSDVFYIGYDAFVDDPERVVDAVTEHFGLSRSLVGTSVCNRNAHVFSTSDELWKAKTLQPVQRQNSKFEEVFSLVEREKAKQRLMLDEYTSLLDNVREKIVPGAV